MVMTRPCLVYRTRYGDEQAAGNRCWRCPAWGVTQRGTGPPSACRYSGFVAPATPPVEIACSADPGRRCLLGSLPDVVASNGAVHGPPCDAEQVVDLCGAVLAGLQQHDHVRLLAKVE